MIAQSLTGTPGHINPMATGVRHFLAAYPPDTLEPGRRADHQRPWMTSGQINDITVVTPVFRGGRIVAYFANLCHSPDIGGRVLSARGATRSTRRACAIPIMKLFDRGEPNETLLKIIRANVRAAGRDGRRPVRPGRLQRRRRRAACCDSWTSSAWTTRRPVWPTRSSAAPSGAMREAIRALPDGAYAHEVWSDGFEAADPDRGRGHGRRRRDRHRLRRLVAAEPARHQRRAELHARPTRPSRSRRRSAPTCRTTRARSARCTSRAPLGSILNCVEPAAVAARHLIGHFLPGAIFGALAQALPGRLMAGGADPIWISVWRGTWPGRARPVHVHALPVRRHRARARRRTASSTTGFPSGVAGVPAEVIETLSPLVQHRDASCAPTRAARAAGAAGWARRPSSSYRGDGPWSVSAMIDRLSSRPGLDGGKPGALGELRARTASTCRRRRSCRSCSTRTCT